MKSPVELTVLVTGSDAPGFASIVRSLRLSKRYRLRIVATDWRDNLKGLYYADCAYTLPDNRAPEFAPELLRVCERERVDVLLPIRTDDQIPICRHFREFEELGTVPLVVTPNPDLMETALNKLRMLEYLRDVAGLPTLEYRVATKRAELEIALEKLSHPGPPIPLVGRRGPRAGTVRNRHVPIADRTGFAAGTHSRISLAPYPVATLEHSPLLQPK